MSNSEDEEGAFGAPPILATKVGLDRFPEDESNAKADQLEQVVIEELAKLSLDEQEKAAFQLVGFDETKHGGEDPAVLDQKRREMEQELDKIKKKSAFNEALRANPDYVNKKKLDFLQYNEYNAKAAAQSLVYYFEKKCKVFGSEVASRDILFDDLNPDAKEFVERGFWQVSPYKDRAGRSVVFFGAGIKEYKTVESVVQAMHYINGAMARDVEYKQNGFVLVCYTFGKPEDFAIYRAIHSSERCMEGVIKGLHICQVTPAMRLFLAGAQLFTSHHVNMRTRVHSGDYQEITFSLQSHGIKTDDQPWQEDDTWSTTWHKMWLDMHIEHERKKLSSDIVITPSRNDVLFGSDKMSMENPGTLRCKHLVDIHWEQYDQASKNEKTPIADKVVVTIQKEGGRFLRREGYGWVEVSNLDARKKVAHYYRAKREKLKKATTSAVKRKKGTPQQQQLQIHQEPAPSSDKVRFEDFMPAFKQHHPSYYGSISGEIEP